MSFFDFKSSDLRQIRKIAKRAPREFRGATAGTLNTIAFRVRKEMINEVNRTMTVRSLKFVEGSIRFQKTRISSVESQRSRAGSIRRARFTGWVEQQTGKPSTLGRSFTLASRGGNYTKKMRGRGRLKPGNQIQKQENFKGKTRRQRTAVMLAMMRRGTATRQPFVIDQRMGGTLRTLGRGLYDWRGRRIYKQQNFERNFKPRRNPWATRASKRFFQRNSLRKIFANEMDRRFRR